ncbi:hypothetical protein SNE40_000697 [Patella caerulea]|uniref:Choice-of-anchor I domain-containing protein n=2 Tax=Patella caerulea TaxID=87958 RepID=A0AAN8K5P4_PATCE
MKFLLAVLVLFTSFPSLSESKYVLSKLSTLYVPYYDATTGQPIYKYDMKTADQIAYDPQDKIIYLVGYSVLYVIDVSDPKNMVILHHQLYNKTQLTEIEFCDGFVFFSADDETSADTRLQGKVYVLKKYQANDADSLKVLHTVKVGAIPDSIKVTKDCRTVVVAVGGEAFGTGRDFQDPKGAVGIIKFPNGVQSVSTYTNLDFGEYNSKVFQLEKDGVRFIYRDNGNIFLRDAQPETIALNGDETIAYVCLQANNAIAEVNLVTGTITALRGLGYKPWSSYKLDASDRDGGIKMNTYDIRAFYQPDGIHHTTWNGKSIIITANEGFAKNYDDEIGWKEEIRGSKILASVSKKMPQILKTALADDRKLGRLIFGKFDGLNAEGEYDHLYTFGGRGISIRLASDMSVLYDSGSVVEEQSAKHLPDLFNCDGHPHSTARESMDTRSDNRGTECEAIETAVIDERLVIFVGCETPGAIYVFSVGDDFSATRFESIFTNIPRNDVTFADMYDKRILSEIDPEDIRYVTVSDSPINSSVLFVSSSESGTLSVFQVNVVNTNSGNRAGSSNSLGLVLATVVLVKLIWYLI